MKRPLPCLLFAFVLLGCASRRPVSTHGDAPPQVEDGSSALSGARGAQRGKRYYFADLQVITDSALEGPCSEEAPADSFIEEPWRIQLEGRHLIKMSPGLSIRSHAINVNLQSMGRQQLRRSFSVIDGRVPADVPFGLRLRQRSRGVVELSFLDQVVTLRLGSVPNSQFTATELRGGCAIHHRVSVFGTNVGFYDLTAGGGEFTAP